MIITIITSVYNNHEMIEEAIQSVKNQSYMKFEHVVVDGGSNDGTAEIVKAHSSKLVAIIGKKDRGIYDGINRGIDAASGEVIGLLHSDDIFASKTVLESVAKEFLNPEIDGVYCDLKYVKRSDVNKVIRNWKSKKYKKGMLKNGWMPPHPTLFLRKKVYKELGGYDLSYKIASDYDLILRLFTKKYRIKYLPIVSHLMRVGGASNGTISKIFIKSKEDLRAIQRNNIGGINVLIKKNILKIPQYFI